MAEKHDVKITVLQKLEVPEVYAQYAAEDVHQQCAKYQVGKEYLSKNCESTR